MFEKKKIITILILMFFSCDSGKIQDSFGSVDCMGDAIPIDCSDTSLDGCAYLNACGVCLGGSSMNEDLPCTCPDNFLESPQESLNEINCLPEQFLFYTTTQQAGYVFELVQISNNSIESSNCYEVNDCDWVGAFNGNVCVGAIQWNTDTCLNGICSINVMGNDYGEYTPSGYMNQGEYPIFKIYDVSENIYYNTMPSQEYPWYNNQIYVIPELISQP